MGRLLLALCLAAALPFAANAAKKPGPRPKCFGKRATIVGNARGNVLRGTNHNDVIVGRGGNDRIEGGGGNDLVCGGSGQDVLEGQSGENRLDGGAGFDVCRDGKRLVRCEETRPDPPSGALAGGEYFLELRGLRIDFTVGEGWSFVRSTSESDLYRRADPGGLHLAFFMTAESPSIIIGQVARLSGVTATGRGPASIDRSTGERIDVENTSAGYAPVPFGSDNALEATDKARFYAVSVGRKTLIVQIEAPDADFAAFVAQAEAVLASVRFEP